MEIKLSPPYAECYSLEYPQKNYRRISDYVEERLGEVHPGFSKESLWDFKVTKEGGIKTISASVMDCDYYMEKRLSQRKVRFYMAGNPARKVFLFESSRFDIKGGRKKKSKLFLYAIIPAVFFAGLMCFLMLNQKEEKHIETEVYEIPQIKAALNVFDTADKYADAIKKSGGSIRLVSFSSFSEGNFKFFVTGCKPYSLVKDITEKAETVSCSCNSVSYSQGKESFELDIKVKLPAVLQKNCSELELLEIQNQMAEELGNHDVKLLSSQADEASGRIMFLIECPGSSLQTLNVMLEETVRKRNLFTAFLEEEKAAGKDLFTVKTELIVLEEKQEVESPETAESLSLVFEKEEKSIKAVKNAEKRKAEGEEGSRKPSGWKKIGSVKKKGREFYYYRTEDGKIEISEADYE